MASSQTLTELPVIQYAGMDYASVIDQIKSIIKNNKEWNSNWTQFYNSEAGSVFIQLMAWICDNLNIRMDLIYNEQFLSTATSNKAKLRLLNQIGYTQRASSSSVVNLQISFDNASNAISAESVVISGEDNQSISNAKSNILKFYTSSKDGESSSIPWEILHVDENDEINYITPIKVSKKSIATTYEDANNNTFKIKALQGETFYREFSSDVSDSVIFDLRTNDIDISTIKVYDLDSGKLHVKVDSFMDIVNITGDEYENIPCYIVETNDNGNLQIRYPSDALGEQNPLITNHLFVSGGKVGVFYRKSNGVKGNIPIDFFEVSQSFTGINSDGTTTTITGKIKNISSGSSGKDRENLEDAVMNAPLTLKTMNRCVTTEDYEKILRNYKSIWFSKTFTPNNMPSSFKDFYGRRINPHEAFSLVALAKDISKLPKSQYKNFPWIELVKDHVINEEISFSEGELNKTTEKTTNFRGCCFINNAEDELSNNTNISLIKNAVVFSSSSLDLISESKVYPSESENTTNRVALSSPLNYISNSNNYYTLDKYIEKDTSAKAYYKISSNKELALTSSSGEANFVIDDNIEIPVDFTTDFGSTESGKTVTVNTLGENSVANKIEEKLAEVLSKTNVTSTVVEDIEGYVDFTEDTKYKFTDGESPKVSVIKQKKDGVWYEVSSSNIDGVINALRGNGIVAFGDFGLSYSLEDDAPITNPKKPDSPLLTVTLSTLDGSDVNTVFKFKIGDDNYAIALNNTEIQKMIDFYKNNNYREIFRYFGDGGYRLKYVKDNEEWTAVEGAPSGYRNISDYLSQDCINHFNNYYTFSDNIYTYMWLDPCMISLILQYFITKYSDAPLFKYNEELLTWENVKEDDSYNDVARFTIVKKDTFDNNSLPIKDGYVDETYNCLKEIDIRVDCIDGETVIEDSDITTTVPVTCTVINDDSEEVSTTVEVTPKNLLFTIFNYSKTININKENIEIANSDSEFVIKSGKAGLNGSIYINTGCKSFSSFPLDVYNNLGYELKNGIYFTNKVYGEKVIEMISSDVSISTVNNFTEKTSLSTGSFIIGFNSLTMDNVPSQIYLNYIISSVDKVKIGNNTRTNYYYTDDEEVNKETMPSLVSLEGCEYKITEGEESKDISVSTKNVNIRFSTEEQDSLSVYNINDTSFTPIKEGCTKVVMKYSDVINGVVYVACGNRVGTLESNILKIELSNINNAETLYNAFNISSVTEYFDVSLNNEDATVTLKTIDSSKSVVFISGKKADSSYTGDDSELYKSLLGTSSTNSDLYDLYPSDSVSEKCVEIIETSNDDNPLDGNDGQTITTDDGSTYTFDSGDTSSQAQGDTSTTVNTNVYFFRPDESENLVFKYRTIVDGESVQADYYITAEPIEKNKNIVGHNFYINKITDDAFPDSAIYIHYINDRAPLKEVYDRESEYNEIEEVKLINYMEDYVIAGTETHFLKPVFQTFDIVANVYYDGNFEVNTVKENIIAAIKTKYDVSSIENLTPGNKIYYSDISKIIGSVDGVVHHDITYLGLDVTDKSNYPTITNGYIGDDDTSLFYKVTILNDITNDTGVVLNFSREDAGTL